MTAKLNIDPQAWLEDVLARTADTALPKLQHTSVESDTADHRRSSGLTAFTEGVPCRGLH
jgi:hypothetical protein